MNQVILFSPVGGTDPISGTNLKDGSMLHICRVYKPSKVIMYMSAEILKHHNEDNRYCYCLDRLCERQNRKMEYKVIERQDLKNVQEFDFFYKEFREIVQNIFSEMDETDTLILNVSSGTPAMKSGLLVLQTLGEFPCKMVQVTTPVRKMNNHLHDGFDVKTAWELNEDNEKNSENRCKEIRCPTLSAIKKEEIIKKHVQVYDYRAALSVAETIPEEYRRSEYCDMLRMAESRLLLDFGTVDKILREKNYNCLPVRESGKRKCFEYALNLQVKLKRREYADFVRAITPLVVDLLEMILKNQCKVNIDQFCISKKKRSNIGNRTVESRIRVWDEDKLANTEAEKFLNQKFNGQFKYGIIYSIHLQALLEGFSNDKVMIELVEDLRHVEGQIRNMAAHEIVSVTEDTIRERTGFTGKQIMDKIRKLFHYTGINLKSGDWDSYDDMNKEILSCIEKN